MLTSAAVSADAATVYFENTNNWTTVYSYSFQKNTSNADTTPLRALTATTIDGHQLYGREIPAGYNYVIFVNMPNWENGKIQTEDLVATDGYVYNAKSEHIATITNGQYVPESVITPPVVTDDLYLSGSGNGWGTSDEYKFEKQEDGTLTLTTSIYNGTFFKIRTTSWDKPAYGGPEGLDNNNGSVLTNVNVNGTYTLVNSTSSSNLYAPVDMVNVTLTLDPSTNKLSISDGSGEIPTFKWFCAYDADAQNNGISWHFGNEMEEQTEGTYKCSLDLTGTQSETNYFAIFRGLQNSDWNTGTRYQPKGVSGNQVVTETGGSYGMQQGTANVWELKGNGVWTIVVDPRDADNPTVSFDWGDSTGEANVMVNQAGDDDHSFKAYAMTAVSGSTSKFQSEAIALGEGDELKFTIHDVDYFYDPSVVTSTVQSGGKLTITYPLKDGSTAESGVVTFDYNAGDVVFVIDIEAETAAVTFTNAPGATMTVTDPTTGDSTIHELSKVTGNPAGDEFILNAHEIEFVGGELVDFRIGTKRYWPDFNINTPANAPANVRRATLNSVANFELKELADADPAPAWNGPTNTPMYIRISPSEGIGQAQPDTTTAVEAIEAADEEAVYFNMQGMRVNNPEKGLYIVKKGNKVAKIVK